MNGRRPSRVGHRGGAGTIVPTRRLVWLVAAAALPLCFIALWPAMGYVALAWDALVLALFVTEGVLLRRHANVEVWRATPRTFSLGETHRIHLFVQSRTTLPLRVELADSLPSTLTAAEPPRRGLQLLPHGRAEAQYEAQALRRGDDAFGAIHISLGGPIGLATLLRQANARQPTRTLPSLKGLRRLELAARFVEKSSGFRSMRREGAGDEFETLREYLPDDDFRHIDWKATARRRRPVTRVFETQRNQVVLLCIETGRGMSAQVGELTKLDHAINSALLLAYAAQRMGDQVGLVLFADEIETFLPPRRGTAQFRRILRTLYAANASATFVDYRELLRAVRTVVRRRALLVFYTDVAPDADQGLVATDVRRLAARHLPMLATLDDTTIRDAARSEPVRVDDAFGMCAASEHLHARESRLRELRAAGALVVDAPPERIGVSLVNRYLELKRTRRV